MDGHKHCDKVVIPLILSGVMGYFGGLIAAATGMSAGESSGVAGFTGFMGAQTFNYVCILMQSHYKSPIKH